MKQPEWMPDDLAESLSAKEGWGCVVIFEETEILMGMFAHRKGGVVRLWNKHCSPFCGYSWEQARRKKRARIVKVVVSRKDGGYVKA